MRLSPLLSAVFAASAILSSSNPSRGETPDLFASSPEQLLEAAEPSVTKPETGIPDAGVGDLSESSATCIGDAICSPSTQGQHKVITDAVSDWQQSLALDSSGRSDAIDISSPLAIDSHKPSALISPSAGDEAIAGIMTDAETTAINSQTPSVALTSPSAKNEAPTHASAYLGREGQSPSEILTTPALDEPNINSSIHEVVKNAVADVRGQAEFVVQSPPSPEPDEPADPPTRPVTPEGTPSPVPRPQPPQPGPSPTNQPTPPPQPRRPNAQPTPQQSEPEVLVAEVVVAGVEGELEDEVYRVISLRPGLTTTRSQLQQDINAIFATGYFSKVRAEPEDTPLGVRVTFVVEANPVLRNVEVRGNEVLPESVIDEIFGEQYGNILNLREFQQAIKQLNEWYQQNGYVLAQVIDTPQISEDGTVILEVAEGVVEDIEIRFINKEGETVDEEGQPLGGRTREYIITRELDLEPGEVFNRQAIERDLQRVFGLGIFEDVQISLNPGENPRNVVVVIQVQEKNTGSIAAGAGISSASGLFGTVSYQEQNLFGRNLKLGAELQVGQRELLFDVNFTDPWIAGDPYRTSYTVNLFRRRSISFIFDGGDPEVELDNGDRPRILRLGGGVTFTRPLENDWRASLGMQYQRVSIRDSDGDVTAEDELGNDLSFSGDGEDDLLTLQFSGIRDRRNSRLQPTAGSFLRLSTEQSVPLGLGTILFNRLRANYSYYIPVSWINFSEGPQTIALSVQGGTIIGDLPPYEAFSLGGTTTVRGYDEGELGTGRSFVQATAEYRFPIYSVVGGALFFDAATDLGTAGSVPGEPADVRNKPGTGFGYGVGIRVQSPIGPIRVDYAINDDGDSRFHFGLGERF